MSYMPQYTWTPIPPRPLTMSGQAVPDATEKKWTDADMAAAIRATAGGGMVLGALGLGAGVLVTWLVMRRPRRRR